MTTFLIVQFDDETKENENGNTKQVDKDVTRNIYFKEQHASNPNKKSCRQIIPSNDSEENSVQEDKDVAEVD
ncbi:hypothetical protein DAPPUDRAFT_252542 [Daphnia pulex]|uniref:Uncharacterized protein n=1 Tax=Daphnia pulex TaxID=6669 RepID=E9H2X6_DAPPU|nr:hypothetical protein DAPPUDRAFT_252542 [Daphnia pulex]|eukprot:EFX73862.1 hypothetical protein DAPPUDRAFT_252542 [Daphnia pulex]